MLLDGRYGIADLVVEELAHTRCTVKHLHRRILARCDTAVTLRAVYKAVSELIESGVVLKAGREVFLDDEWLHKLERQILQREDFFGLETGDVLVYNFTSLAKMDAFWKTFVGRLKISDPHFPVFFYNPHDIWVLLPERKKSELQYYQSFEEQNIYGFYVIGGSSILDKEVRKMYQSDHFIVDLNPLAQLKRTDHVTIHEDYVITAMLPGNIAQKVDELYNRTDQRDTKTKLLGLVESSFRARVKVERNAAKAKSLRKVLSKNFLIPGDLRKKYDLF